MSVNAPIIAHPIPTDAALFTGTRLDEAFHHVCRPPNSDIWHLRFHRAVRLPVILDSLNAGTWRLSPMTLIPSAGDGEGRVLWSAEDAVVITLLTEYLRPLLPVHARCEHLAGHGGGKHSVLRAIQRITDGYTHIIRTDIKGYYASIHKDTLYSQLCSHVTDPRLRDLLHQFLHYSTEYGGEFHTPINGMCRSSALSPLLAAFHLTQMNTVLSGNPRWHYVRYMDDILIFTRSAWQLRRAVRALLLWLNRFGFERHPDKTFTGKICQGFDWMGFWLTPNEHPVVAPRARQNHLDTLRRLYERTRHLPAQQQVDRVAAYQVHWQRWAEQVRCASHTTLAACDLSRGQTRKTNKTNKTKG